jgi:uncharacterized protein
VTSLRLGDELELPVDVVTRTVGVIGQKGTGKTSTAVVAVEEASAAGARFAWMDPTGAASGLRASADGEGPGLDCVVMGGFHGDVPLDAGAGEAVARLVVEEGYSVVCDLERMPRSQQVAFVADFSETALELCRSAVTVVFDEAPRFVPQGGAGIEEEGMRCRVAVTELVMLGRRKGLGSILISQRPSKLHKDVLEQADLLIAHRLMGVNDRKAIGGWLEEYDVAGEWLNRLPKLRRGEAVVLAPEYELGGVFQIRPKRTFDSSATPDVGAVLLDAPRARGSIDLGELEAKMGRALEHARENDPEALRRRVRELEARLEEGAPVENTELRGHLDLALRTSETLKGERDVALSRAAELEDALRSLAPPITVTLSLVDEATPALRAAQERIAALTSVDRPKVTSETPTIREELERAVPETRQPPGPKTLESVREAVREGLRETEAEGPPIKAGAKRMLEALLDAPRPLNRTELSTLAVVRKGGTMSDYLSALRTHGLIAENGQGIAIPGPARGKAQDVTGRDVVPRPRTPQQIVEPHARALKAGTRRMLEHLMRAHPDGFTRSELSRLADVSKGGTFSDYLSALKTRGLAVERAKRVYAGEILYLWEQQR